jgi:hypothetical protein
MYRFTSVTTGDEVAVSDNVYYIKVTDDGTYAPASEEEATGIAINSEAYNLLGKEDIGGKDTIVISEFNGGEYVANQKAVIDTMLVSILEG